MFKNQEKDKKGQNVQSQNAPVSQMTGSKTKPVGVPQLSLQSVNKEKPTTTFKQGDPKAIKIPKLNL